MQKPATKHRVTPGIVLFLAILAVSTASIFIKFAQVEAASIVIGAYRLVISSLVLLPIVAIRFRNDIRKLGRKDLLLGAAAGIFLAVHFGSWITSLQYTSVVSSVVLVTTTPLWVALAAPWVLKEPLTRNVILGLALALMGTTVIGIGDASAGDGVGLGGEYADLLTGHALFGDFLALVGAWTAAGYVLIGRRLRPKMNLIPYVFVVYSFAAVALSIAVLVSGESAFGFSRETYFWLVLLAIVPQLIGHSTFNWALGFLPATFVAITLLGEPIGSSILAYLVLNERPGLLTVLGGIVILTGIGVASVQGKRPNMDKIS
jgi:drug/metabolite transporter (DMT)-like permease